MHSIQLTRKCVTCGQVKSLSNFLLPGNIYGNICSSCRANDSDDRGSTSKGLRVDDKAKNLAELDQKKREEELKELKQEYVEENEKLSTEKKDKKQLIEISEKRHREYLDTQKAIQTTVDKKKQTQQEFQETKEAADIADRQQNQEAGIQKETGEKTEKIKTGIDFTAPFNASQTFQAKYQTGRFREFMQWLGTSAPGTKAFETPNAQKSDPTKTSTEKVDSNNTQEKKSASEQPKTIQPTQAQETKIAQPHKQVESFISRVNFIPPPPPKAASNKQPNLVERTERTWGPSSRK